MKHVRLSRLDRRRAFVIAGALATGAIGACVTTSFDDGKYACTPGANAVCPEGLLCARDGRCRTQELPNVDDGGEPDTGIVDAGTDANVDCSNARWRTLLDARAPEGVEVRADGRVFTAGTACTQGWIAEIDRCPGVVLKERTILAEQQTSTAFRSVASQGDDLVVAGGSRGPDGGQVYHGKFSLDLEPATPTDRSKLPEGEAQRIAIGSDGTNWLIGSQVGGGFVTRVGSTICSASVPSIPGGIAPRDTGAADFMRDGNPATLSFVDSVCAVSASPQTLAVGTGNVDVTSLIAARGSLIATGTANGTLPNTYFWIAESKTGATTFTYATLDPNTLDRDTGRRVVFDGESLFVLASQRASFNSGTPTLYRYNGAITFSSKPFWATTPFGPVLLEVRDLAVAPTGGDAVYVTAATTTTGGIARCTKAGECQP